MKRISGNKMCGICGDQKQLQRHHVDWDHNNNSADNVIIICQRCHTVIHQEGINRLEEITTVRNKVMERDPSRFEPKKEMGGQLLLI